MSEPIPAYPLTWPLGRTRTRYAERSRFDVELGAAIKEVQREVRLLRGSRLVISSNLRIRLDGLPYASQAQPDDCGVAVYFDLHRSGKVRPMCFACDRWRKVEHNLHAISLTIEALRGLDRWGTGDMVEQAFTGFLALPAPEQWFQVLGVPAQATRDEIQEAYRRLASEHHPDRGGDPEQMSRINRARDDALERASP